MQICSKIDEWGLVVNPVFSPASIESVKRFAARALSIGPRDQDHGASGVINIKAVAPIDSVQT